MGVDRLVAQGVSLHITSSPFPNPVFTTRGERSEILFEARRSTSDWLIPPEAEF